MKKAKFYDVKGQLQEVELNAGIYKEAHDLNMTVGQLLENRYETDADKYGTVLEQFAESTGLMTMGNKRFGLRAPTLAEVLEGGASIQAGVISKDSAPASRIIFPAVILEVIENQLVQDYAQTPQIFDSLIALDDSIAGSKYEQPVLDFSKPAAATHQGQAQGSLPSVMGVLSVSEVSRKIPTFSLGLEITDEALKATTLDFVTLSLRRQVMVERNTRTNGFISAMVNGDVDVGQAALANTVNTNALDAACPAGQLSHKAWVLWLFRSFLKRNITHVMCDIATAYKIETRANKPTVTTDDPQSVRIDAKAQLLNYILSNVKLFVVENGVIAADTIVGIDARYAIRRIRNTEAQYQASEAFVMRRVSQLRFDFGEILFRLFDDAWDKLVIV